MRVDIDGLRKGKVAFRAGARDRRVGHALAQRRAEVEAGVGGERTLDGLAEDAVFAGACSQACSASPIASATARSPRRHTSSHSRARAGSGASPA